MNQRDDTLHELISAYIDGELSVDERARVEQLLGSDREYQHMFESMRALAQDMQALPSYQLDDTFANRVLTAAHDAEATAGSGPTVALNRHLDGPDACAPRAVPISSRRRSLAATVVLVAAAAVLIAVFMPPHAGDSGNDTRPLAMAEQSSAEPAAAAHDSASSAPLKESASDSHYPTSTPNTNPSVDGSNSNNTPDVANTGTATETDDQRPPASLDSAAMASVGRPPNGTNNQPDTARQTTGSRSAANTAHPQGTAQVAPVQAAAKAPRIELGPGANSIKMLLVIDVKMTQAGWDSGRFETLLRQAGIPFEANILVKAELEKTLLESRFFESAKPKHAPVTTESSSPLAIVYVAARGGAIDRVWQQMKRDPSHFTHVRLDMALQPGDTTVFRQIQQLGATPIRPDPTTEPQHQSAAHRLVLPPSWQGQPVEGSAKTAGLAAMLNDAPPAGSQDAPRGPMAPSGGLFGGNVYTEALFVLHCAP